MTSGFREAQKPLVRPSLQKLFAGMMKTLNRTEGKMMKHITEKKFSFNSMKSNVALIPLAPIIF